MILNIAYFSEQVVDKIFAGYVSMCRRFIKEPGLVKRRESGDRKKSARLSDNHCYGPLLSGDGVCRITERNDSVDWLKTEGE